MDTGRAITQTAQLHAACKCMGNAIITFFTLFDSAPCDKKSRSEHQTLFPLFGEGSGDENKCRLCQNNFKMEETKDKVKCVAVGDT